jgi:hypothetical protein
MLGCKLYDLNSGYIVLFWGLSLGYLSLHVQTETISKKSGLEEEC